MPNETKPFTDKELELTRELVKNYEPANECEEGLGRFLATIDALIADKATLKQQLQYWREAEQHKAKAINGFLKENETLIADKERLVEALKLFYKAFKEGGISGNIVASLSRNKVVEVVKEALRTVGEGGE